MKYGLAGYGFEKSSLAVNPRDNQKTITGVRVREN
jgi:hypothetical protein